METVYSLLYSGESFCLFGVRCVGVDNLLNLAVDVPDPACQILKVSLKLLYWFALQTDLLVPLMVDFREILIDQLELMFFQLPYLPLFALEVSLVVP